MSANANEPSVVVGVGLRPSAGADQAAVAFAAGEASWRTGRLTLLHAVESDVRADDPTTSAFADRLRSAVCDLDRLGSDLHAVRPGVDVEPSVRPGAPAAQLVEATARGDLVVVGTGRADRSSGPVLSPVAWRTVAQARGPMVLVPPELSPGRHTDPVMVLAGCDAGARAAARFATLEAAARSCPLLAIGQLSGDRPDGDRGPANLFGGLLDDLVDLKVEYLLVSDLSPVRLLDAVDAEGVGLLVVGVGASVPLGALVAGVTAAEELGHDPCGLAVVRA